MGGGFEIASLVMRQRNGHLSNSIGEGACRGMRCPTLLGFGPTLMLMPPKTPCTRLAAVLLTSTWRCMQGGLKYRYRHGGCPHGVPSWGRLHGGLMSCSNGSPPTHTWMCLCARRRPATPALSTVCRRWEDCKKIRGGDGERSRNVRSQAGKGECAMCRHRFTGSEVAGGQSSQAQSDQSEIRFLTMSFEAPATAF